MLEEFIGRIREIGGPPFSKNWWNIFMKYFSKFSDVLATMSLSNQNLLYTIFKSQNDRKLNILTAF